MSLPSVARERKKELRRLEKNLGIRLRKIEWLQWALQHRSYVNENPELKLEHNERLEFLGDSVLGHVIAQLLCEKFPTYSEGKLSLLKSSLVNRDRLAQMALDFGLSDFVLLGKGEMRSGGHRRHSILADTFEAVIAVHYLDRGFKDSFKFLERIFAPLIREAASQELHAINPKNKLQKWVQGGSGELPQYRIDAEAGPQHRKTYYVTVLIQGREAGRGSGATKKKAEEEAALDALKGMEGRAI